MHGRTNFGDSIEDEWVIVYLLRELTKKHHNVWAKAVDGDGQFLLVEAAATLPAWLEPEVADNRVSHLPTIIGILSCILTFSRCGSIKANLSSLSRKRIKKTE